MAAPRRQVKHPNCWWFVLGYRSVNATLGAEPRVIDPLTPTWMWPQRSKGVRAFPPLMLT